MTLKDLNSNPYNRKTHIVADGDVYHSDIAALTALTEKFKSPVSGNTADVGDMSQWLCRKGMLEYKIQGLAMDRDWTQEPEHTVSHYRQLMCERIQQKYQNIVIAYSGGTDSDTIADTFLQVGAKGVTLLNVANTALQKHTSARQWLAKHTAEAASRKYASAVRDLGWKVNMFEGWNTFSAHHYEQSITDNDFMSYVTDYHNLNGWAQNSGEVTLTRNKGQSTCWIMGLEKPHLTVIDGWYCYQMSHDRLDTPLSVVDPDSDVIYFWMDALVPELIIKLAHCKAREIKKVLAETGQAASRVLVESFNMDTSPYYQRLNSSMDMAGLTGFLMTNETKNGDWRKRDLHEQSLVDDPDTRDKKKILDRHFDQVISRNIHHDLIDLSHRKPISILTKPKRIMPI